MGHKEKTNRSLIVVSIVTGIIYYFYLLCLAVLTFRLFGGPSVEISWHKNDLLFLGLSLLLFILVITFHQVTHMHRNKMVRSFKAVEPLLFVGASILFCLSLYSLFVIPGKFKLSVVPAAATAVVFSLMIFFCIVKIEAFILKVVVVNFFLAELEDVVFVQEKNFELLETGNFLEECDRILELSSRIGTQVGFVAVRMTNINELEAQHGVEAGKFIRKQLIFLITENSRIYEPWTRTGGKDIYIKVVEVRNRMELEHAEARFLGLLKNHQFTVIDTPVKLDIVTASTIIDKAGKTAEHEFGRKEMVRDIFDQVVTQLRGF